MLVEKTTKEFVLSKEDKQAIKNNAQKIRNYITKMGYDSCADFFDIYCDNEICMFLDSFEGLPFKEEEYEYITEDDIEQLVSFIDFEIEDVNSCITKDDFDNKDDLVEHTPTSASRCPQAAARPLLPATPSAPFLTRCQLPRQRRWCGLSPRTQSWRRR